METNYKQENGEQDDEALDILWNMVMEEGNEDVMKSIDSDSAQTMLKSHSAFSSMLVFDESVTEESSIFPTMEIIKEGEDNEKLITIQKETINMTTKNVQDDTTTSLMEIVDFTPERAIGRDWEKDIKLIVSCCNELDQEYEKYLVLVEILDKGMVYSIHKVQIVPLTALNPFTYKCYVPNEEPGDFSLFIIQSSLKSIQSIHDHVTKMLSQTYKIQNSQGFLQFPSSSSASSSSDVTLLSQLSKSTFQIINDRSYNKTTTLCENSISETNKFSRGSSHKLGTKLQPPTNPAMALVATALTDYTDDMLPTIPTSSTITPTNRKRIHTLEDASTFQQASRDWANEMDEQNEETNLEKLDRHCKIRLVERLTDVITETDNETITPVAQASSHRRANSTVAFHRNDEMEQTVALCAVEDINIDEVVQDDENIDNLMDGLLVKTVENLLASNADIKQELNKHDQSGFTLLHYASLYNLATLLPILFLHDVSPNILTKEGNLTPLHLACSAGNFAAVELLVRQQCSLLPLDSYGATPIDLALRNGFPEIATWLAEKADVSSEIINSYTNNTTQHDTYTKESQTKHPNMENMNKQFLQNFAQLNLKDRIETAMNFMDQEDQEELKKDLQTSMHKWIVKRNYVRHKQIEAKNQVKCEDLIAAKENAKKRLDEAIAGFVLRKTFAPTKQK